MKTRPLCSRELRDRSHLHRLFMCSTLPLEGLRCSLTTLKDCSDSVEIQSHGETNLIKI